MPLKLKQLPILILLIPIRIPSVIPPSFMGKGIKISKGSYVMIDQVC